MSKQEQAPCEREHATSRSTAAPRITDGIELVDNKRRVCRHHDSATLGTTCTSANASNVVVGVASGNAIGADLVARTSGDRQSTVR